MPARTAQTPTVPCFIYMQCSIIHQAEIVRCTNPSPACWAGTGLLQFVAFYRFV